MPVASRRFGSYLDFDGGLRVDALLLELCKGDRQLLVDFLHAQSMGQRCSAVGFQQWRANPDRK